MKKWKTGQFINSKKDIIENKVENKKVESQEISIQSSDKERHEVASKAWLLILGIGLIAIIIMVSFSNNTGNEVQNLKTIGSKKMSTEEKTNFKHNSKKLLDMNRKETTNLILDFMINNEITDEAKIIVIENINEGHKESLDFARVMKVMNTEDNKLIEKTARILGYNTADGNEKIFLDVAKDLGNDHKGILRIYSGYKKEYFAKKDKIYKLNLNTDALIKSYMSVEINDVDFKNFIENKSNNEKNEAYMKLAKQCKDSNEKYKMIGFETLMIGVNLDMNSDEKKEFEAIRKEMKEIVK